jgi:creatinine amidohydrolase/Fe(II)-dependent formamide hydrolase-like protein
VEVKSYLDRDGRLLVPIGACDQYGPHLPIGAGTRVAEAVTATLSRDFGILRAPTVPFGVNLPAERHFPGTASLSEKTLHRMLNDLLASWQDHGFTEFILITAHSHDPHVEAIATVSGTSARVRVLEILGIDFSGFLDGTGGPQHGGEVLTSLMLYLHPDKVNLAYAEDFSPPGRPGGRSGRTVNRIPLAAPGSIGQPRLATRDKGERIFHHIVQKIRSKVFLSEQDEAD